MKKVIGNTLALAAACGLALGAIPAGADDHNNAALVINQSSCGGFLLTESGFHFVLTEEGAQYHETSSGNAKLVCNLDVIDGPELATAEKTSGFGCAYNGNFTTDTRAVITPGGKATAVCTFDLGA